MQKGKGSGSVLSVGISLGLNFSKSMGNLRGKWLAKRTYPSFCIDFPLLKLRQF
jgi:hypothetical protein